MPASAFATCCKAVASLTGAEVVTLRGPLSDDRPQDVVGFARGLLDDPRIGWISITDNPGGGPMLPPDWLTGKFAGVPGTPGRGANIVVHLTCKRDHTAEKNDATENRS